MKNVFRRPAAVFLTGLLVLHHGAAWACPGDCNGSGAVTAAEITRLVAIILLCDGQSSGCPAAPANCAAGDADGNGRIEVPDLIVAIQNVLRFVTGCPDATPTPSTPTSPSPAASLTPTETRAPTPPETPTLSEPTHTATATRSPSATSTPTSSATATLAPPPTPTPTPTAALAVCGNGTTELGESCDDGNRVTDPPADTCPADCTILTCSPSAERLTASVQFSSAVGVASIAVIVEYPDGAVQLPGTSADPSVGQRITNRPSGFLADWFDFDYAVRVALVGTRALSGTQLFRISFDRCTGAAPPRIEDFSCRVAEANDTSFRPLSGVTCAVVLP